MSRPAAKSGPSPRPRGGAAALGGRLRPGLWAALAGLAALGGAAPSARAQVVDDEVEVEVTAEDPGHAHAVQFRVAESSFDQWAFGSLRTAPAARARLEILVKLKIDEADRAAQLTEAQKEKLDLAARGDIKRYFDLVEEMRRAFRNVQNDQQKFATFYQQLQPMRQMLLRGLFDDESLFAKTLKKTLDPRQVVEFDRLCRQRTRFRQEARIGRVLATLDGSVGLDSRQRRQLLALIVEATTPPKFSGPQDVSYVLYQLARLPRERVRPIFHEKQWPLVSRTLDQARTYEAMLTRQGVLPAGPLPERWDESLAEEESEPEANP